MTDDDRRVVAVDLDVWQVSEVEEEVKCILKIGSDSIPR